MTARLLVFPGLKIEIPTPAAQITRWGAGPGAPKRCEQISRKRTVTALVQEAAALLYSSRIKTAAAIVVVHLAFLSPTALCVTLLVRTILFEMR